MDTVRGEQLGIIGFHCRRGIFELSVGQFFSQGGLLYRICWLEKFGNLKHNMRFKKVSIISKRI
jgi:hypothetical protein